MFKTHTRAQETAQHTSGGHITVTQPRVRLHKLLLSEQCKGDA